MTSLTQASSIVGARGGDRAARLLALMAADAFAILLSSLVAYVLWALPARGQSLTLYLPLTPLVGLFLIGYAGAGLYPGFGLGPVETLRRLTLVTGFGFLVLASITFALKVPAVYSRATFGIAFALSLLLAPLGRLLASRLGRRWAWWAEPVLVIADERRDRAALERLTTGLPDYRTAAILGPGKIDGIDTLAAQGLRVVIVEGSATGERWLTDRLQRVFQRVVLLDVSRDLPVEGVKVRNLNGIVGFEYTSNLLQPHNRILKRTLDVCVAGCVGVISLPLVGLAFAAVWLVDGAPVLYRQERTGLRGRRIAVPKVRSMRRDAERQLVEHLRSNPHLREEWERHYKLRDDPRLIPVLGRLLRRSSIDELPQLWSVVRGEMSLVGPRPLPDYHLGNHSTEFQELRHQVRPGVTGLWQVTVRADGAPQDQETSDAYYIRNWSVWLDVYVLSRTALAVIRGAGAY